MLNCDVCVWGLSYFRSFLFSEILILFDVRWFWLIELWVLKYDLCLFIVFLILGVWRLSVFFFGEFLVFCYGLFSGF